jgi:acetyl/propionyl-CoA carboxylase alpha subunit
VPRTVRLSHDGSVWTARAEGSRITFDTGGSFDVREEGDGRFSVEGPDGTVQAISAASGASVWAGVDGYAFEFRLSPDDARPRSAARDHDALAAPMPATVVRIPVRPGDRVEAGDTLVVLEAMKMELPIRAPRAGTVRAVHCEEGRLVQPDMVLVELGDS